MPTFSCKRLRHRCVQHSTGGAWQLPASPKVHCAHRAVQYRCHLCVASRQRCQQRTPTSSKRPSPHAKYMRCGVFASRSRGFLRNFVSTRIFNEHDTSENVTVHHFPNFETSIIKCCLTRSQRQWTWAMEVWNCTGSEVLENKITRAARPADWRCYAAGRARRRGGAAPRSPP